MEINDVDANAHCIANMPVVKDHLAEVCFLKMLSSSPAPVLSHCRRAKAYTHITTSTLVSAPVVSLQSTIEIK